MCHIFLVHICQKTTGHHWRHIVGASQSSWWVDFPRQGCTHWHPLGPTPSPESNTALSAPIFLPPPQILSSVQGSWPTLLHSENAILKFRCNWATSWKPAICGILQPTTGFNFHPLHKLRPFTSTQISSCYLGLKLGC